MPDIQVVQTNSETGISELGLGRAPKILTGVSLLAQLVVIAFLKNPGRDVIDPNDGSGLRDAIGQYNLSDLEEIKLLVLQRTKNVEKQIFTRQSVGVIDPSERLKKLSVLSVASDPVEGRVLASIRIINEAGESQDILV
jgi:hypothetical protein